jgi:hypothetical protein
MPAQLRFIKDDFDGDSKTVSWDVQDPTEQGSYAAFTAANALLYQEINKWSAGRDHAADHVIVLDENGPGRAALPIAQGNLRLIVEGQDTVNGQVYRFPIPMPDLAKAADGGSDPAWLAIGQGSNSLTVMNPDHTDYGTFKTQFEATVKSPNDNPVVMVRGYIEE